MATQAQHSFGQTLVDANLLSVDALALAEQEAAAGDVPLGGHLVASGRVRKADALQTIAGEIEVEFIDPAIGFTPDPSAIERLDASVAVSETALPLRVREGRLVILVADPLDQELGSRLETAARGEIELALGPRDAIDEVVRRIYLGPGSTGDHPAVHVVNDQSSSQGPFGAPSEAGYHLNELLDILIDAGGSDLHLTTGTPPQIRLNGVLQAIEGYDPLKPAELRAMVYGILTARQKEQLENSLELDASHPVPGRGRFRVNVFFQRGSIGAVMRAIPNKIVDLESLGMPPVVAEFTDLSRGIVLVTGATGSGKSTTLASMIDLINRTRPVHVVTVEDPIEFMHSHKRAIVNQREVGADTTSFAQALRHTLRQDPDVILVGEMRDLETMSTALTAAETGHLVFATLHTQDAPGSIERVIDVFPPHQQQQIRVQLAESLAGVVTQQLLPTVEGRGRVPAVEVMVATPAIRNLVREGKVHQIRSAIQAGGRHGMQTMDHSLAALVRSGKVDLKLASERAHSVDEFMNLVGGAGR
jgi:twitching motility protein PilT